MATVFNIGLMVLITRVIGVITKQKVKVLSGMLKVMCIEVNSKMIWPMGMENTPTSTDQNTRENSKMTCRRDMEKKNGLMVPNMLEATKME
jgi:hypothetical protein